MCDLNECGRQCWGELLESRLLVGVCVQDEGDHALPLPLDIHRHGLRGGDAWGGTEADTTIEGQQLVNKKEADWCRLKPHTHTHTLTHTH